MQSEEPIAYQFGEFIFDLENNRLIKANGEEIELSNLPFNFLKYLLEKKGKSIKRDQIIGKIWEGKNVGDGSLAQLVGMLRKEDCLNDKEKKIIKNRPGLGYSFGIEFEELDREKFEKRLAEIKSQKDNFLAQPAREDKNEDLILETEDAEKESIERSEALPPQPEEENAPIESGNAREKVSKSEVTADKPTTFEEWLANSGVKWFFRSTVILTILSSIIFSVMSRNIKVTVLIGSISNVLLVTISLLYYRMFSLRRLKNFRPFSEDTTSDLLRDEVREATKCKDKLDWETTRDNAKDGSGIFRVVWQILLLVWIFLYTVLAVKTYVVLPSETKELYWLGYVITFFNNLNTLLLAICFYTFNTLEKGIKELKESGFWIVGLILIIVLTGIEALLLYHSVSIPGALNSVAGGQVINENGNIFWLVNGESINIKDEVSWIFRVLSGVGGAIALALFVGRLQSKFFNAATKFTVIFFSYIAIQPLFVFFEDNSLKMQFVTAIVIHIAVALKYYLFLYLCWTFESGRLLFYLVRVRQANREVEDEWQKFQIVFEKPSSENSIVS